MKKKVKKFALDEDLKELFDEASEVDGNASKEKKTNSSAKSDEVIYFEIINEDDELTAAAKNLINESNITLQQVYDKKGQRDGYNMKYSVAARQQLGWKRVIEWCNILHKVPEISFRDMTEEEIELVEKKFKEEKNKPKNKKKSNS